MDRCLFRRSDDFLVRCAQIGNADVVADGIMKQVRFLRTIAFVFTQGFCVDVCDIRSGKQNPATVLIPEAHNKLQKGGFATLDNFLTVYHFFHITVYISKGFLLKHKKCTYFSCNSFYNLQNEKHNKQSYNRQPNAGIEHTNKHRNNSKYRGNKLCQRLCNHLAERIRIIGVKAHNIAVSAGIEDTNRKPLHFFKHIISDFFQRSLCNRNHCTAVKQTGNYTYHIYDTDCYKCLIKPSKTVLSVPSRGTI